MLFSVNEYPKVLCDISISPTYKWEVLKRIALVLNFPLSQFPFHTKAQGVQILPSNRSRSSSPEEPWPARPSLRGMPGLLWWCIQEPREQFRTGLLCAWLYVGSAIALSGRSRSSWWVDIATAVFEDVYMAVRSLRVPLLTSWKLLFSNQSPFLCTCHSPLLFMLRGWVFVLQLSQASVSEGSWSYFVFHPHSSLSSLFSFTSQLLYCFLTIWEWIYHLKAEPPLQPRVISSVRLHLYRLWEPQASF